MGLEFLARVRRTSLWTGALAAVLVATYVSPGDGWALALGDVWSLLNLALLQALVVAVTSPGLTDAARLRGAGLSLAGMLGLFAGGAFLLLRLPPQSLLGGFLIPFGVMVLKAASLILLGSRLWRRIGASSRAGGTTALLLLAILVLPLLAMAASGGQEHGTGSEPAGQTAEPPAGQASEPPAHGPGGPAHGEHGAAAGPEKFANVITVLSRAFPDRPWAQFLHEFEAVFFSLLIALLMSVAAYFASRNAQLVPGRFQNAVEFLVEKLYDFVVGILGPHHGPRYVPFLGTLFLYILAMNLFGLIPFMDSPTSSLNVTVGLAIAVFLYAQAIGFKRLGVIGYFDHMAGSPRSPIQWALVPLMLPIHVLGEFAKPISLSCRLFGNVFGEDMLLVAFATLGVATLAFSGLPVGLPLQLPFLFLALLTGTLQALVFTVLSTIYFLLMLPHDEHADHPEEVHTAH